MIVKVSTEKSELKLRYFIFVFAHNNVIEISS